MEENKMSLEKRVDTFALNTIKETETRNKMLGSTIYLSGEMYADGEWVEIEDAEPCPICFRMIKKSGISRIVSKKGITDLSDLD